VRLRSLSQGKNTSVVRFFDFGRNLLLFQTAQSELRTSSVSFTLHQTKMHIPEEWGINAGDNWEGMQLKKLNLHSQTRHQTHYFHLFGKG
jgi:hypothetical protein